MGILHRIRSRLGIGRRVRLPEPPFPAGDPRREMFTALAAYVAKHPEQARNYRDDFVEFIVRADPEQIGRSLAELIAECQRLGVELPPEDEIHSIRKATRRPARVEADLAAKKMHEERVRRGLPEQKHYYTAVERAQTGEVDRTYDVDKDKQIDGAG